MKYVSTRGGPEVAFDAALLAGFAPDGGLYLPVEIPQVSAKQLRNWVSLSYPELVVEIASLYVDEWEVTQGDLEAATSKAFNGFPIPEVVSLSAAGLDNRGNPMYVAELYHGESKAFKDLGLRWLAAYLDSLLRRNNAHANAVVCTSGDTGGSAIAAVRGLTALDLFVLFPRGRCSPMQVAQMATMTDANVHVYDVADSTSDLLDDSVKPIFEDEKFCNTNGLCSLNSANWGRIMVQIVHFFFTYLRAVSLLAEPGTDMDVTQEVVFSIPSGGFGNGFAGLMAKRMGLPVRNLVFGNCENDGLHRFFSTGVFDPTLPVLKTSSPALDIQVAYNMERALWLVDRSLVTEWVRATTTPKSHLVVNGKALKAWTDADGIVTARVTAAEGSALIRALYRDVGLLLDPHSVIGVAAYLKTLGGATSPGHEAQLSLLSRLVVAGDTKATHLAAALAVADALAHVPSLDGGDGLASVPVPVVCLGTAHPGKFPEVVSAAFEGESDRPTDFVPPALAELMTKPHVATKCGLDEVLSIVKKDIVEVTNRFYDGASAGGDPFMAPGDAGMVERTATDHANAALLNAFKGHLDRADKGGKAPVGLYLGK